MTAFYETVARYYDAETGHKTDDLILYSQLAEAYGGPIFEVGCGTGRVLLHLAQEGYTVHGIDTSEAMLDRLENKLRAFPHLADLVTYTHGSVLAYEGQANHYNMALLTYNAMMHFHDQDAQLMLLQRLHHLLTDDGLLVIDLPNAGETFVTQDTDALVLDRTFIDDDTGHMVMLQSVSYLDRTQHLMQVQWIYDEITEDGIVKRLHVPHVLRYYFYPEMTLLLEKAGFRIVEVFGSVEEDPFEDGCERMVIYAQRA